MKNISESKNASLMLVAVSCVLALLVLVKIVRIFVAGMFLAVALVVFASLYLRLRK